MRGRRGGLGGREERRPHLHAGGAEGEGRSDPAAVRDPAGGDDGHVDGVHDLRHERDGSHERLGRGAEERHPVPGRLGSRGDDRIDSGLGECDGFRDRGGGAHDADAAVAGFGDESGGRHPEHHAQHGRGDLPDRVELFVELGDVALGPGRHRNPDGLVERLQRLGEDRVLRVRRDLIPQGQPDV